MAAKLNLKIIDHHKKHYPGSATFHNPLHSHWSLPLKEDQYCQANNTNLLIEKINFSD
jgi:hypothetical protein